MKLNFNDMQGFISMIVDGVNEQGLSYKPFFRDFAIAKYYCGFENKSDIISEIYDNELSQIDLNAVEKDKEQYADMMRCIDDMINDNLNMLYKSASFSNTDMALSDLVYNLGDAVDKIGNNINKTKLNVFISKLTTLIDKISLKYVGEKTQSKEG